MHPGGSTMTSIQEEKDGRQKPEMMSHVLADVM